MTDRCRRILVIDDSREYLGFMDTILTAEGYSVDLAPSLTAAREILATTRPDLVISDVRLPGDAAFGILDLLRADEKTHDIPVLLCTGAVQEVDEAGERLAHAGADVLFKPFDIDDLLARIGRLCGHATHH